MWNNQTDNISTRYKLLVYYNATEPKTSQIFWAFKADERKPDPLDGLRKRILKKYVENRYKLAIFYDNGQEVERWESGIRIKTQ